MMREFFSTLDYISAHCLYFIPPMLLLAVVGWLLRGDDYEPGQEDRYYLGDYGEEAGDR